MTIDLGALRTLRHDDLGDGVRLLTLNRPERRNAWTLVMAAELDLALRTIDADASARALVVTGAGDVFSVGADLESGTLLQPGDEVVELPPDPAMPSSIGIPVIAALNGHAAGGGINFAMHCDLRVLADSAKVAFPFVKRGVVPEMNMNWLLPRIVGLGVATDLLLTGRTITADEALALGVVHRMCPAAEVLDHAIDLARELVRTTSPLSSSFTKQLVHRGLDTDRDEAWEREMDAFERCADHDDAVEGVTSFLERRDPRWTARREPLPSTDTDTRRAVGADDADTRRPTTHEHTKEHHMSQLGATVKMTAKEGKGDELATALLRVRAEVLKEPGCVSYEILRSAKQPDDFTLVEVYRDRDALKAHQKNESLGPVSAPLGELSASMDVWLGEVVTDAS